MKTIIRIAIGLAGAGLAAGCGSSGEPTSAMTPPPTVDAFTQSVQTVVANSSDASLPISIDDIAVTDSDSAPPVAL
jgi:uncharacterized protein YcfL